MGARRDVQYDRHRSADPAGANRVSVVALTVDNCKDDQRGRRAHGTGDGILAEHPAARS
jgi:hypothetical protein